MNTQIIKNKHIKHEIIKKEKSTTATLLPIQLKKIIKHIKSSLINFCEFKN